MKVKVNLYSEKEGEIKKFLNSMYNNEINLINDLKWEYEYDNPVDINDIIGTFIENNDNYKINMWVSLDKDVLINVSENNVDELIRYLYERFPY